MKKGSIVSGHIEYVDFPNKGVMYVQNENGNGSENEKVIVKGTIPGQKVSSMINKGRKGRYEARLLSVDEKSPLENTTPFCPHFGICGGCCYQELGYENQLELKAGQVKKLLDAAVIKPQTDDTGVSYIWEKPVSSPKHNEYRNKMEFTFGNEYKDGPLVLGLHKKGSFYDIVPVHGCAIMDSAMREILTATENWARESGLGFYHKMTRKGYFRHLLVRRSEKSGEILVDLVTCSTADNSGIEKTKTEKSETVFGPEIPDHQKSSDNESLKYQPGDESYCESKKQDIQKYPETAENYKTLLEGFTKTLCSLSCGGRITGILHTVNDSTADAVIDQGTEILYGKGFFTEELLGLNFKITPFSFFQTNSLGAEMLYEKAREYVRFALGENDSKAGVLYDLYSGTGTIGQLMAAAADKVFGIEIVEEAVVAANENAALNGLDNCSFIAGDVFKKLDELSEKPDIIILDPPREGVLPKALSKILVYGVENLVYISCKPTSLANDLAMIQEAGYRLIRACCVDMFPFTANVETVAWIQKKNI